MAKAAQQTTNGGSGKEVTTTAAQQVPAAIRGRMLDTKGAGLSHSQADNQTPLVRVLQVQSPQCNKRNPDYVEGAEGGVIWLKGQEPEIIDGEKGFWFQPCHFQSSALEWVPRSKGGGFAARHVYDSRSSAFEDLAKQLGAKEVEEVDEESGNKVRRWKMPSGNELVDSREYSGNAYLPDREPQPFVVAFSKSGLSVSREWMQKLRSKRIPGESGELALWCTQWLMTTKFRKNAQGEWFSLTPSEWRWTQTEEEMARGEALFQAFESGARRVEDAGEEVATSGSGADQQAEQAGV